MIGQVGTAAAQAQTAATNPFQQSQNTLQQREQVESQRQPQTNDIQRNESGAASASQQSGTDLLAGSGADVETFVASTGQDETETPRGSIVDTFV